MPDVCSCKVKGVLWEVKNCCWIGDWCLTFSLVLIMGDVNCSVSAEDCFFNPVFVLGEIRVDPNIIDGLFFPPV